MATKEKVFVGIDVAFAKKKRLPISVCAQRDGLLRPFSLREDFEKPPAGKGNRKVLESDVVNTVVEETAEWLEKLEDEYEVQIERIAIDAPKAYCSSGAERRISEAELDKAGISCFSTPTKSDFDKKIEDCKKFLSQGGKLSRLPNSNQLWMLVGFKLFEVLGKKYDCIETYPQAIVQELKCATHHKSTKEGLNAQLEAVSSLMEYDLDKLKKDLKKMGFGSKHDQLDAFLSAWVASLPDSKRKSYGTSPDDAIWVPNVEVIQAGN